MEKMSQEPSTKGSPGMRRVPVIVRSWDGPNSRIGLEMDLSQMPWGPFDALGKRLNLLLPVAGEAEPPGTGPESHLERALRHVEHAADRCGEFAQLANGDQDLWLRSQQTWEWIRRYLTALWVQTDVDGVDPDMPAEVPAVPPPASSQPPTHGAQEGDLPVLPGAAATLRVAAEALRGTPLAAWRETVGSADSDAPTREEAVQTLLGVARILSGEGGHGKREPGSYGGEGARERPGSFEVEEPAAASEPSGGADPDQVSFDFAKGYDEGYQMGRRVGLALGARKGPSPGSSSDRR